jgi:hypothetical protein
MICIIFFVNYVFIVSILQLTPFQIQKFLNNNMNLKKINNSVLQIIYFNNVSNNTNLVTLLIFELTWMFGIPSGNQGNQFIAFKFRITTDVI